MSEENTTISHTPISYSVPSDYEIEQWGRSRGDVSTKATSAKLSMEGGRYFVAFPVPTSKEEAHRFNQAAEFLATAGSNHAELTAFLRMVADMTMDQECATCGSAEESNPDC